ncbi:MAG: hypothetical protein WC152_08750 [Candidatus Izemoplasmatales bacterium]
MNRKRQKDEKEVLIYNIFSKVFLVLGFVGIFSAIMLEDQQPDKNWMTYGIIVFLLFNAISLYLKNIIKGDKEKHNLDKKKETYNNLELSEFSFTTIDDVFDMLVEQKYKLLSNGYYHKRITSQGVCCYGKFHEVSDLEETLAKEIQKFKKFLQSNCKAVNGIIFFSMSEVKEEDKAFAKKVSRDFLLAEQLPVNQDKISVIVVLIDKMNKKVYFLNAPDSYKTRIYSYGAITLRNIFDK